MPGLVHERGRREVVRGDRRDARAVGVELGDVDDGQAADGLGRGAHRAGLHAPASVRRGRRGASNSAGDPVQQAVRDLALGEQRQLVARPVGAAGSRPGWCRCRTRSPARETSLATSRSAPLRRSLSGARSSEPGLGREPDDDRPRVRASRARAPTSARMSSVGSSSRVRPVAAGELRVDADVRGRKSATAAAMTRASARVVDDGVDDGVAHRRRSTPRWTTARRGRQRDLDPARDDRDPRAAVERRLRDRDAHPPGAAVADEPDGVDGLRRPARAHDDVAALQVAARGPRRRPAAARRDRAARTGRVADRRDHGVDDVRRAPRAGRRPTAPTRAAPTPARTIRYPKSPRSRSTLSRVAGCVHMSPSIAGATTTGADGREAGRGHGVGRDPVGHRAQPAGRRRAPRRSRRPCRRPRCARSAGRGAAPGRRSRRGAATGRRT